MKNLIKKFESLKGASFISVNNYESSSTGEIANHVINVNISVKTAKETDLARLKACTETDLKDVVFAGNKQFDLATAKLALSEMIAAGEKNLSANIEDRSNQSIAQSDAYIFLTPAIRLHKDTLQVHIFGQAISKTVLIKGIYKTVNSAPKTIAKNFIKKHLDLRSDKFRDFILGNIDTIRINGETLELTR